MKIKFISNRNEKLIKQIQENSSLNFNQIKSALRKKDIKINGKRMCENLVIEPNSLVEVFISNKSTELNIVYEDENVILVNKPAGIEVTSSNKQEKTLDKIVNAFAVHRLDRNTSGLVILAKNILSKRELDFAFKNKLVKKIYTTVVVGVPKVKNAKLTAFLLKDKKNSLVKIFDKKINGSVQIKTNFELLNTNNYLSLLRVELLTGKTHQIRAHLAHINLPVLGDEKYGDKLANKKYGKHKQLLVATSLFFNFNSNSMLYYLNDKTFTINPNIDIISMQ